MGNNVQRICCLFECALNFSRNHTPFYPFLVLCSHSCLAFNSFFFEMVNGRGWICIALVVFGSWKPGKTLLGAVLFAAFDALQIRVQQTPLGADIPYQIFLMAPYILSILALVVMSRRAQVPAALMVPFNKGER